MCLYPQLLKNKKYTPTKKNNGIVPDIKDERTRYIPVGCGKCIECLKKKAQGWKIRLNEEIRYNNKATFVTLTFNENSLQKLKNELTGIPNNKIENEIATLAVRRFLERWRKKYKISIKHWLITEKGHKNTERIHLHGIIWSLDKIEIEKIWSYGWIFSGEYVNEKTINYIMKYVTKIDLQHKWFVGKVLTSPGMGKQYINREDSKKNVYRKIETNELYTTRTGAKMPIPIYYRNKIYSEDEREELWINKLNEEIRYVCGEKIDVSTPEGEKLYEKTRDYYRNKSKKLGLEPNKTWNDIDYNKYKEIIKYMTNVMKNPGKNMT